MVSEYQFQVRKDEEKKKLVLAMKYTILAYS
jgi:hypothetical protein